MPIKKKIETVQRKDIAYVNIRTFQGMSFNAEHYYGDLKFKEIHHNLEFKISKKYAEALNEKDSTVDGFFRFEEGDETNRYQTKEAIKEDAVKYFRIHLIQAGAKLLCLGDFCVVQPQPIIASAKGYELIMKKINDLFNKGQIVDWDYDQDEKLLDGLNDEWQKIVTD